MHQHEKLLDFIFPVRTEIGKMTSFIAHSKLMAWDSAAELEFYIRRQLKHEDCGKYTTYTVFMY